MNPEQQLAVSNLLYGNQDKKTKVETVSRPSSPEVIHIDVTNESKNTVPFTVEKPTVNVVPSEIIVKPTINIKASEMLKVGNELQLPKVIVQLNVNILP